ncbi:MAG: hypothetical protein MUC70_01230, partial [Bacteroidales bacterium]|nr:hypothetical protein [Bacteroidales bacterium]
MSEKKEKVADNLNEDLTNAEISTENTEANEAVAKGTEVVTESAGEEVAEERPILKEKKVKKVRVAEEAAAAAAVAFTAGASPEEFDWDAYEKDGFSTEKSRASQEKLYEETLSTVAVDEVVDGKVISMNNRE